MWVCDGLKEFHSRLGFYLRYRLSLLSPSNKHDGFKYQFKRWLIILSLFSNTYRLQYFSKYLLLVQNTRLMYIMISSTHQNIRKIFLRITSFPYFPTSPETSLRYLPSLHVSKVLLYHMWFYETLGRGFVSGFNTKMLNGNQWLLPSNESVDVCLNGLFTHNSLKKTIFGSFDYSFLYFIFKSHL